MSNEPISQSQVNELLRAFKNFKDIPLVISALGSLSNITTAKTEMERAMSFLQGDKEKLENEIKDLTAQVVVKKEEVRVQNELAPDVLNQAKIQSASMMTSARTEVSGLKDKAAGDISKAMGVLATVNEDVVKAKDELASVQLTVASLKDEIAAEKTRLLEKFK